LSWFLQIFCNSTFKNQFNIHNILWLAAGQLSNQNVNLSLRRERKNHAIPSPAVGVRKRNIPPER
jgi:hypothetical protein